MKGLGIVLKSKTITIDEITLPMIIINLHKALSCARDSCRTSGAAFAGLIVCRLHMSLGVDTTHFSKEERGWSLTNC